MMKILKPIYLFPIILIVGLALRFWLSFQGYHIDILSNAGWGDWLYHNGTKGFYGNTIWTYSWPTQPPLVNLLYGFAFWLFVQITNFMTWFGTTVALYHLGANHILWWYQFAKYFTEKKYADTTFPIGFLVAIKLLAIFSDIAIAGIIFLIGKSKSIVSGLSYATIFLLLPFSWQISALWGQYDSASFLFLLVAFLLLYRYKTIGAILLFSISLFVKPTGLIFLPFFGLLLLNNRPKVISILTGIFLSFVILIATTAPFTNDLAHFLHFDLPRIIFYKAEFKVTNNAFNIWYVIFGNKAQDQNIKILFLPAYIWGYSVFGLLTILAYRLTRVRSMANLFAALFIVAGSWLFLTNMLERYFYAAIVFGLIATLFQRRLLPFWLILTAIFSINLFNQWWFPMWLLPLKEVLIWNHGFLPRVLSLINIIVFAIMVLILIRKSERNSYPTID